MEFASKEWLEALRAKCNESGAFQRASENADTNLVFMFGETCYFWKLYRGAVIDSRPFVRSFDTLGYDVVVRGPVEAWQKVISRQSKFWDHYNGYEIEIGGNHLEAHRLHEAILIICQDLMPTI